MSVIPGDLIVEKNLCVKNKTFLKNNVYACNYIRIGSNKRNISKKRLDVNGQILVEGVATFNSLPIMGKIPIEDYHLVNKAYVDSKFGDVNLHLTNLTSSDSILGKNNTWTGKNNYNKYLPTSSLTPSAPNHFATKAYVDSKLSGNNLTITGGNLSSNDSLLGKNNNWTGTNNYTNHLPTSNLTPSSPNQLTTKEYVDNRISNLSLNTNTDSLLNKNNTWTGTNNFNLLPTSNLTPTSSNQLVNKAYVDNIFSSNNVWTGTNNFNLLPTSSSNPTSSNQLVNKAYVDNIFSSNNVWTGTNNFNLLPTSSATVLLNNQLTTKEYVDNAISSFTGSSITVSPGSSNNYLTFVTGTSGNQSLYVDSRIMYNATTDTLTVVNATITGTCNATVSNATNTSNININSTTSTNTNCSIILVGNQSTGNQPVFIDTGLTYNANDDTLTVAHVNANLNGTATNATNINIRATTSDDTTCSVVLVGNQSTGNQQPFIDGGLMYNANTDNLTASSFTGNLLGNVIGNVSANLLKVGANNGSNISQILVGTGVLTRAGGGTDIINVGTLGLSTSSKIFVTFTLSPAGISWFYVTPNNDQFIITASGAPVNDVSFNWVAYN